MKLGWSLGFLAALVLHAAFLLFGGIFFPDVEHAASSVQAVELLDDLDEEKDETKPDDVRDPEEPIASDEEPPPDAEEILKSLEAPSIDSTPALEAASLSAIEAALSGQGGGGDFAQALTFGSGGQIGGTGTFGGAIEKAVDEAFNLAELEQKPSVVFQKSPDYPVEMRNKKVEGLVTIRFIVDAAGKVDRPIVKSSSHSAFESPALAAIKKWKFEPGLRAGQRVASKMEVTIRFPKS